MKRYQECNIFVRLYRRLKYQPYYFYKALFAALKALYSNEETEDPVLIFKLLYGEWQMKANWYYTSDEVFEKLEEDLKEK